MVLHKHHRKHYNIVAKHDQTSSAAMEHYDFWNTPKISSGQPVIGVIEAVSQKKNH
jgi:hypothetical protein